MAGRDDSRPCERGRKSRPPYLRPSSGHASARCRAVGPHGDLGTRSASCWRNVELQFGGRVGPDPGRPDRSCRSASASRKGAGLGCGGLRRQTGIAGFADLDRNHVMTPRTPATGCTSVSNTSWAQPRLSRGCASSRGRMGHRCRPNSLRWPRALSTPGACPAYCSLSCFGIVGATVVLPTVRSSPVPVHRVGSEGWRNRRSRTEERQFT